MNKKKEVRFVKIDYFSVPFAVRAHRQALHLTQKQFGDLIHRSYVWVSLFERGLIDDNGYLDTVETAIELKIEDIKDKKLYRLNWILAVYDACRQFNICVPRNVKNMIKQFSADISK